jgi:parallel beta-helix repeat protein
MKSKTKLIISILTLIINLGLLLGSIYYLSYNNIEIITPNDGDNVDWQETYSINSTILIIGNETGVGAHNWSWAVSQSWCTGSGLYNDPYIIENLVINAYGYDCGIAIINSDAPFIIQSCSVFNASITGIELINIEHGKLVNNTIYNNSIGIQLIKCEDNYCMENFIFDNDNGILVDVSLYNNITRNVITENRYAGVNISHSYFIVVHENNLSSNLFGIWQKYANLSIIYYNHISYNIFAGIYFQYSSICQIIENNIIENPYEGIAITTSDQNLLTQNYFINNTINGRDDGINNQWDYNSVGNYWSDYLGVDADDDGIGDTPYIISGVPGSQDNYPIWDDGPG